METKHLAIKSIGEGTARVVIATLNAVDKDGDLTPRGAFGNQVATIAGAHDWSVPTLGVAKIREVGNEAIAELKFNLSIAAAAEWFKSIKFAFENGVSQQWSYGFDVIAHSFKTIDSQRVRILESLKVHEVSPVMQGAGIDTRTLDVKQCQTCAGKAQQQPREPGILDKIIATIDTNDALLADLKKLEPYFAKGRIPAVGDQYVVTIKRLSEQISTLAEKVAPKDPDRFADVDLVIAMRANLARRNRLN